MNTLQKNDYAYIHLLRGYKKPLLYKVPLSLNIQEGDIVSVPFQKRHTTGIVTQLVKKLPPQTTFTIREIEKKERMPHDVRFSQFISHIAEQHCISPLLLYERLYSVIQETNEKKKKLLPFFAQNENSETTLTVDQQKIFDFLLPYIESPCHLATLIHGVTGSGKSEVYAALITSAIKEEKSVFLLLPDVSLALQFQKIFTKKFGDKFPIVGFHSASPLQEKKYVWDIVCKGTAALIIGVHLPVLLPCSNLGLIIVDEEHDQNFQEKRAPHLNSKQVALIRAQRYNIPILLGSATPSLASLHQVKEKHWKFFQLTQRFSGSFPTVKITQLSKPKRKKSFWISEVLEQEIQQRLTKKEQIIIYINRRGYSFFVMCKECGFVFTCSSCSVSMTVHTQYTVNTLQCHYCTSTRPFPEQCSECGASSNSLLKKGIGTQHVVSLLSSLFPHAKIARADLETTRKRTQWKETMNQFERGEIDILVGTQTITKGYHFPRVTLVGIIWGDLNLHLPSYDATERTLQQLIQVAGRAGRATQASTVIVQVVHDHPVFSYIEEQNYLAFYKHEIEFRKQWLYPPFSSMVTVELSHIKSFVVHEEVQSLFMQLSALHSEGVFYKVQGPLKPPVHRIQKKEYRHILIKTDSLPFLKTVLEQIEKANYKSSINFRFAY